VFTGLIHRSALNIFGIYVAKVMLIFIKIGFHFVVNKTQLKTLEDFMNSAPNKEIDAISVGRIQRP
jgi:hypothetical protein